MEYYGIIPEQKLWVKLSGIIFGIYVIYSNVMTQNWIYMSFGFIMIITSFSKKKHIISETGVDILYSICGIEFHNIWTWKEISAVYKNSTNSKPNIEFHIAKDLACRKVIISANEALNVLDIISKMNPLISIKELNRKNK